MHKDDWPDPAPNFPEREQPPHQKREPLDHLRGSVTSYERPLDPVWPEESENTDSLTPHEKRILVEGGVEIPVDGLKPHLSIIPSLST